MLSRRRTLLVGVLATAVCGGAVAGVVLGFGGKRGRPSLADLLRTQTVSGRPVAVGSGVSLRKISRDPYSNPESTHEGAVEPSIAANGRTTVVAYQVARAGYAGAAAAIGFATSRDRGASWSSGFLPALTIRSSPPGHFRWASDPSVAYDAAHGTWLIASLAIGGDTPPTAALVVSRSRDGISWQPPKRLVTAARLPLFDKPWIACDDWPASRFRGTCYYAYTDDLVGRIAVLRSADGGATWSGPVGSGRGLSAHDEPLGAMPAITPDGVVRVFYVSGTRVLVTTSTDGGADFSASVRIASFRAPRPVPLRAPLLPTAAVDGSGTTYLVWVECSRDPACTSRDVVMARLPARGGHWTTPRRIVRPGRDVAALLPALAADGANVVLVYYEFASAGRTLAPKLALSHDGGTTWTTGRALSSRAMKLTSLAGVGRPPVPFVGDYVGVTLDGARATAAVTIALPPRGRRYRQGIYMAELD